MWPPARPETLRFSSLVLLCGIVLTQSTCDGTLAGDGVRLPQELARLGLGRTFAPRLSIPLEYRACSLRPPGEGTVQIAECGGDPSGAPRRGVTGGLSPRRTDAGPDGGGTEELHAAALMDLLWARGPGIPLQRSISSLQTLSRLSERPAPPLADLAAAYLVRAEWTQDPRDLQEAIEVAERALESDPGYEPARFNLALALDRFGLNRQALREWRTYLEADSVSEWAEEVRRRIGELEAMGAPPPLAPRAAGPEVEAYVAREPQAARSLGWDHVLGEWGDAVITGDMVRAEDRLRLADALGGALERRGMDLSLADEVRAIRAGAGKPAAIRRLARAHQAYAAAQSAYRAGNYPAADSLLARVLAHLPGRPPLYGWARAFRGATQVYVGDQAQKDRGERLLREEAADADTLRHPALAGRARWMLGTTLLRKSRFEEARSEYRAAERSFVRAGEHEHVGAVQSLAGVAEHKMGDLPAAHASIHEGIARLRRYPGSTWLHGALYAAAELAVGDGLTGATLRILDEDNVVAARTGNPVYVAEARITRARLLGRTGRADRATSDIREGRSALRRVKPGTALRWLTADLLEARAAAALRHDPGRAVSLLDSAVAAWEEERVPLRVLPPLIARAEAKLALGRNSAAEIDLRKAVMLLDRQRREIASAPLRATLLDATRAVFDRMVMLRVAAGRPDEALAYQELGRASVLPAGSSRPTGLRVPHRSPAGEVALVYGLVGDTLLIWTVADTTVRLIRTTLDVAELARTVEGARALLARRADEGRLRPHLQALYEKLVRPVEGALGRDGTPLVLVADGEVAEVPFAALFDSVRGRYLVQDRPIRFAPTLRDASRTPPAATPSGAGVLLVGAPAFDRRAYPGLARLPGSAAEIEALEALYPGAAVLAGPAADRTSLVEAFGGASLVHFAGHAVFDEERPDRSFLVLAGDARSGELRAAEIGELRLPGLRLVVLSACQTVRSRHTRSGGFAGLAGAFLSAGAGGVVGSLWSVEDQATRVLMTEFHRAYRSSGHGAGALREAQLRMLRSSEFRSPAAWAGFRYSGS